MMSGERTTVYMHHSTRARGMTLLEVMVAASILAVLLVVASETLRKVLQVSAQATVISELSIRAREAHGRVVRELKMAAPNRVFRRDGPTAQTYTTRLRAVDPVVSDFGFRICAGTVTPNNLPTYSQQGLRVGDPIFEEHTADRIRRFRVVMPPEVPDPDPQARTDPLRGTGKGTLRYRLPGSTQEIVIVDRVDHLVVGGRRGFELDILNDTTGEMRLTLRLRARDPQINNAAPTVVEETATFLLMNR